MFSLFFLISGNLAPSSKKAGSKPGQHQVRLLDVGPKKIQVIKEIQLLTGLDTAEVGLLVERVPSLLLDDVDEAAAFHAISRIEGAGGMKTVVLMDAGRNKIAVIKVIRELTDLGLKEAKDLAERLPSIILDAVSSEAAARARTHRK